MTAPAPEIRRHRSPEYTLYEDDKALDVLGYISSLRKYWLPSLVVGALILGLGSVYALTRPSTFTGQAYVLMSPKVVETEAQATQQAALIPMQMRSYVELINSPVVQGPVARKFNVKEQEFKAMVNVGWPSNSMVLILRVTADSQKDAVGMANGLADGFLSMLPGFSPGNESAALDADVIHRPEMPLAPKPSTKPELLALSLVAALSAALVTSVLLDLTVGRRRRRDVNASV